MSVDHSKHNIIKTSLNDINTVAHFCFYLYPLLEQALKTQIYTEYGKAIYKADTAHEHMEQTLGYKLILMTQFARLGNVMESIFRNYFMHKKNITNLGALKKHPEYTHGIFQRVLGDKNNLQKLYMENFSIDLEIIEEFHILKKLMIIRHVYVHNSGLIDEKAMEQWKEITGEDLLPTLEQHGYPETDVYWFKPLDNISEYIEGCRRLISKLEIFLI